MKAEIRGGLTALALLAGLVLLLISIDIGLPGQAILQSLRFHIAGAVALLAGIMLLAGSRWRGVVLLLLAGLSAGQGASVVLGQLQARDRLAAAEPVATLRWLSFNALQINPNGAAIADYILASGADVVAIQEAGPLAEHLQRLGTTYPYRVGCDEPVACDMLLLSRFPLENARTRSLGELWSNRFVQAEAVVGGQRVTFSVAHVVKPYFDEHALSEMTRLRRVLEAVDTPLILSGDFNAAPWSINVDRLMRRAALVPAPNYPATWPPVLGPAGIPIDNVFTRGALVTAIAAMPDPLGSNHRGLIAEIAIFAPEPAE